MHQLGYTLRNVPDLFHVFLYFSSKIFNEHLELYDKFKEIKIRLFQTQFLYINNKLDSSPFLIKVIF